MHWYETKIMRSLDVRCLNKQIIIWNDGNGSIQFQMGDWREPQRKSHKNCSLHYYEKSKKHSATRNTASMWLELRVSIVFIISYFCYVTSFCCFALTSIESQNEILQKNDKELLLLRMHFPFDVSLAKEKTWNVLEHKMHTAFRDNISGAKRLKARKNGTN